MLGSDELSVGHVDRVEDASAMSANGTIALSLGAQKTAVHLFGFVVQTCSEAANKHPRSFGGPSEISIHTTDLVPVSRSFNYARNTTKAVSITCAQGNAPTERMHSV